MNISIAKSRVAAIASQLSQTGGIRRNPEGTEDEATLSQRAGCARASLACTTTKKNGLPDLTSIQNKHTEERRIEQPQIPAMLPIQPPPVDDPITKRRLILMIQRYILEFDKFLPPDLHITDFRAFSIDMLVSLLDEIKFTVAVRNSSKMNIRAIKQGIGLLETVLLMMTPLKVQGLSNIVEDEDFAATLKELMLDNMELFYVSPKYRLAYALLTSIANLHIMNSRLTPASENKEQHNPGGKIDLDKQVNAESRLIELDKALEI